MSTTGDWQSAAEAQRQLDMTASQLALYARDLKRIVDQEREKSRELADAHARLEVLDRLKTDFLIFISHELRTPLNAMSAVNLFDPHADTEEQAAVVATIQQGYERLLGLVEKGLEYFNWLAIERVATKEMVDLTVLVRQAAGRVPELVRPDVDLRFSAPAVPCLVRAEAGPVTEMVRILLANALKFSPGKKSISVDLAATGERVTLAVTDHGVGFPPELAAELFRPFTITDVRHHQAGTGLSLAHASAIVEAHGGRIRAASPGPGKGASFVVDFPAVPPREAADGGAAR